MNLKQKLFYAVGGFVLGNLMLASLVSGVFFLSRTPTQTEISFRQAASRIKSGVARSINIGSAAQSPSDWLMFQLFRLLFILFIISPPIIVVLLLVIISKMNRKKSLE